MDWKMEVESRIEAPQYRTKQVVLLLQVHWLDEIHLWVLRKMTGLLRNAGKQLGNRGGSRWLWAHLQEGLEWESEELQDCEPDLRIREGYEADHLGCDHMAYTGLLGEQAHPAWVHEKQRSIVWASKTKSQQPPSLLQTWGRLPREMSLSSKVFKERVDVTLSDVV